MDRFFIDFPCEVGRTVKMEGENARHALRVLRLRPGEPLVLCDGRGGDYYCTLAGAEGGAALCRVERFAPNGAEPRLRARLYQCLPKADKMDWIVQKAVELGVSEVVPVLSARCVSRPDAAALEKKAARWQKIAQEAAMQSGRGVIPRVRMPLPFSEALRQAGGAAAFCYEGGGAPLRAWAAPGLSELSLFIGPEGGFSPEEAEEARRAGAQAVTLGPRILRTETAGLAALAAVFALLGE